MSSHLFRQDVVQQMRPQWQGDVLVAPPRLLFASTAVIVFFAAAFIALVFACSYTQRHSVEGRLVPVQGAAALAAPLAGRVKWVGAADGEHVTAGDALLQIEPLRVSVAAIDGADAVAQKALAIVEGISPLVAPDPAVMDALARQLLDARTELAQIEAEQGTRGRQLRLARDMHARYRQFAQLGYVSRVQLDLQQSQVLDRAAQVQALHRQAAQVRQRIARMESSGRSAAAGNHGSEAHERAPDAAMWPAQVAGRGSVVIKSPVDGVLSSQVVKAGQSIRAGQLLMSVLPGDGRLEAELLVPGAAIGAMAPGDTVQLRYAAFPYQQYGHQAGMVVSIGKAALAEAELLQLTGTVKAGGPFYRVTVELAQQSWPVTGAATTLKPGMRLDADLLGERRRVIEWVLEPLQRGWRRLHGA